MEKQDKTFGSLTILDKVYIPDVDNINERKVMEIKRDKDGVKIQIGYSTITVVPSCTVANDKICVNKAKAVEIQHEMRKNRLLELQVAAQKAINKLNEFSSKYF